MQSIIIILCLYDFHLSKKVITHPRVRKTIYKEERKVKLKFALPAVILIAVLSLNVNGTIENPVN
jgi:hypothetical protein